MSAERFLVTGAMGCIGAWVTKLLVEEGADVTAFDLSDDDHRLRLIMDDASLGRFRRLQGDVVDPGQVAAAVADATHVIHLAALQIPFCQADPSRGAAVNVTGTVNVFEAVKAAAVDHLVFASSVAVYGPPLLYDDAILPAEADRLPATLYGAYKVADEDVAKVYWQDDQVASIGLRPHSVYGPGRDQGLTSQPSAAIVAAARGEPYHIDYGGTMDLQYVADVARLFIQAARAEPSGGETFSIQGSVTTVAAFVEALARVTGASGVTHGTEQLPLPHGMDDDPLRSRLGSVPHTTLEDGIAATAAVFRKEGAT